MFAIDSMVQIDPDMRCDILKGILGISDLGCTFKVLKIEDFENCSCNAKKGQLHSYWCDKKVHLGDTRKYWVTIELPNGGEKRMTSNWLTQADN